MSEHGESILQKSPLYDMFTAVPAHYDLLNRILTWGLDRRWRRKVAEECLSSQPGRVLDLCCGTGDLAIDLTRLAPRHVEVTAVDFCEPMLEVARAKAEQLTPERTPSFIQGDAANLPFADGHFDCVGTSFSLRNLTYKNPLKQQYMAEVLRVLRPGGRWVMVETSQPGLKLIRDIYHLYLRCVVAGVGSFLAGQRGAYRYLAESAARFYTSEEIRDMLLEAGFCKVSFRPLFFGVVGIHVALK